MDNLLPLTDFTALEEMINTLLSNSWHKFKNNELPPKMSFSLTDDLKFAVSIEHVEEILQ